MDVANNPLLQKSIEFSLLIIKYIERLEEECRFVVAKQLLRSATSIGANAMEAQSAESKADFIHSLSLQIRKRMKLYIGLCSAVNLKIIRAIQNCNHFLKKS